MFFSEKHMFVTFYKVILCLYTLMMIPKFIKIMKFHIFTIF